VQLRAGDLASGSSAPPSSEAGILAETGELGVGDLLDIYGSTGVIRALESVDGEPELKPVVDLLPGGA
jgi:hypothetical protein